MPAPRSLPLLADSKQAIELERPLAVDPGCKRCPLHGEKTKSPCMRANGAAGGILFVAEQPGKQEDREGVPLIGKSGSYLRRLVRDILPGVDHPVAFDNATRCFNEKRKPEEGDIAECRGYLWKTVQEVAPERIIALGAAAAKSLLGSAPPIVTSRKAYGWLRTPKPIPVLITMNPAAALRNRFLRAWFEEDLAWAMRVPRREIAKPPWAGEILIVDPANADRAVRELSAEPHVAYDAEWAGLMFEPSFQVLCVSVAKADGATCWTWGRKALADPTCKAALARVLTDPDLLKVGSNVKDDNVAIAVGLGIEVRGMKEDRRDADVRLERKLWEAEASGELEDMAFLVGMGGMKDESKAALASAIKLITRSIAKEDQSKDQMNLFTAPGFSREEAEEDAVWDGAPGTGGKPRAGDFWREDWRDIIRRGYKPKKVAFGLIPEDVLLVRNARDAVATSRLFPVVRAGLKKEREPAWRLWEQLSSRQVKAWEHIERWGLPVDRTAVEHLAQHLQREVDEVMARLTPYEFDPNASAQVAELLFEKLKLKHPTGQKTEKGLQLYTGEDVLEQLRDKHEVVGDLLDHRSLTKMLSTYVEGMLPHIRSDGRVHPHILIDGTRCLALDSVMPTSRGCLRADAVIAGDLVITHKGRTRPVLAVIRNPPMPLVRVSLAGGQRLRTSEEHEYLTTRGWVRADALGVGDVVLTHSAPEEWRPIPEWPFEVSSWGRVRHRAGKKTKQKPLTLFPKYRDTPQGHLKVILYKGDQKRSSGNRKDFAVHKLVLEAFGPPRSPGQKEGRHLNGIPWDNYIGNLAWGTAADNRADARRHGTMLGTTFHKLTVDEVAWIRRQPKVSSKQARGEHTDAALARKFGVSREMIREIRADRRRTDLRTGEAVERRVEFTASAVVYVVRELPEPTIGLIVEEDHSHVTAGIVTHNSGRVSAHEPNLLNVKRVDEEDDDAFASKIKACVVAPDGKVIFQADQSQVEPRAAAMFSKDENLIAVFDNNLDLYLEMAKAVAPSFGVDPTTLHKKHDLRAKCKVLWLALMYGKSDASFARDLHEDIDVAKKIRRAVMSRYADLDRVIKQSLQHAKEHGGVWTCLPGEDAGRWSPLWRIADNRDNDENDSVGTAERGSWNRRTQGRAADFVTDALCRLVEACASGRMPAKVILSVYDSVMLEVDDDPDVVERVADEIRHLMTDYDVRPRLKLDMDVGKTWAKRIPLAKWLEQRRAMGKAA